MDGTFIIGLLLLLTVIMVFPVLLIVILVKTNALSKRMQEMEERVKRRLDNLEGKWQALQARIARQEQYLSDEKAPPQAVAPTGSEAVGPPEKEAPLVLDEPLPEPLPLVPNPAPVVTDKPNLEPVPTAPAPPPTVGAEPLREPGPTVSTPLPIADKPDLPKPLPPRRPPKRQKVDWEIWLGARGAAVMAGVLLALAALFLFRYSIEQGYLSPAVRVIFGITGSIIALALGEGLRRRDYGTAGASVAGAGITGLYASFWAAHSLYQFTGPTATFLLLIAVTLLCGWLSLRHQNQVVAFLGLAGGFATPLMVASQDYDPIGLFGYLLLLNAGLMALARYKDWPWISLISLSATFAYQLLHFITQPSSYNLLNSAIILVFAAIFLFAPGRESLGRQGESKATKAGAMLGAFILTFLLTVDLGEALVWWKQSTMLLILSCGACYASHRQQRGLLAFMAAWAQLGVIAAALMATAQLHSPWVLMGWSLLPTLAFAFLSLTHKLIGLRFDPLTAAISSLVGLFLLTTVAALSSGEAMIWPWLLGWLILAGLLMAHSRLELWRFGWLAGWLGLALAMGSYMISRELPELPGSQLEGLIAAFLITGLGLYLISKLKQDQLLAFKSVAILPLAILLILALERSLATAGTAQSLVLGFAILGGWALLKGEGNVLYGVLALFALLAQIECLGLSHTTLQAWITLVLILITGAWFAFAPVWLRAKSKPRLTQWTAAAALLLWLIPFLEAWQAVMGHEYLGLMPLFPAVAAFLIARFTRRQHPVWSIVMQASAACVLVQLVPFIFGVQGLDEREWWILGSSCLAATTAFFVPRLNGHWSSYQVVVWAILGSLALLGDQRIQGFEAGFDALLPLVTDPGFLVPILALILAAVWLSKQQVQPVKPALILVSSLTLIWIFVWLNQMVSHLFAADSPLAARFDRQLAGDLVRSLTWALFSLALMAIGIRRNLAGLRKAGLGMLVVTLGKVFLYDVSELKDLYRVASLMALAGSLLGVSMAYKKFVKKEPIKEVEPLRNESENDGNGGAG